MRRVSRSDLVKHLRVDSDVPRFGDLTSKKGEESPDLPCNEEDRMYREGREEREIQTSQRHEL